MNRLVFVIPDAPALSALECWAQMQREQGTHWRLRLWARDEARSPAASLPHLNELQLSDISGLSWRGAVWAAVMSAVLITVLWPYSRELSEAMQAVVRYALPGALIFFGLWLGGLLGTMRVNPVYEAYREAWSTASGLVFVDCPTLHQRLLRRELAQIGLRYLDTRHRYLGSYRYPQNALAGRRAL